MADPRRFSLLVLLWLIGACLHANAIVPQKLENEVAGATEGRTNAVRQATRQHDADYCASLVIDGTATCPRPRSLVQDKFSAPVIVDSATERRDVASGGKWFNRAEREAREGNSGTVWGPKVFDDQWGDLSRDFIRRFADSQVENSINLALLEDEPMSLEINRLALPRAVWNVDGHDAWNWPFQRRRLEVFDNVGGSDEITLLVNEESGPVDQLKREPAQDKFPAEHRDDRMLYSLNGQDEGVGALPSRDRKAPKKKERNKDVKATSDSHNSGVLSIANDGKAIGCDTSDKSSSTVVVSCPQIDAAGAQKEAHPSSTHDQPTPPPSQE